MNRFLSQMKPAFALAVLAAFYGGPVQAQNKVTAKPAVATNKVAAPATTTTSSTTTSTTPPAKGSGLVLDQVLKSPTKLVTLHDHTDFKSTPKYVSRKAKYDKNEDGSGLHKDITYPDNSKLKLSMVKNPSFGGQATNISSHAKLKAKWQRLGLRYQ